MSWDVRHITYEELEAEVAKRGPNISFPGAVCLVLEMEHLPDGIRSITIHGAIRSETLKALPDNISLVVTKEDISLHAVETVGNNVTIKADGNVAIGKGVMSSNKQEYMSRYPHVIMGNNVTIETGCYFLIPCLVKLGDNATFNSFSRVDLNGLAEMGSNISIESRWHDIELSNLTTMGTNVTLKAEWILMKKIPSMQCNATINVKRGVGFKDKPLLDPMSRKPLW